MGMLAKQVKIKSMQDIINRSLLIFFVIHIYKHGKFYKLMEKILRKKRNIRDFSASLDSNKWLRKKMIF